MNAPSPALSCATVLCSLLTLAPELVSSPLDPLGPAYAQTSPGPLSGAALIARGASWRYLDTGVDAGTAWRSLGFKDLSWKQGPAQLGYGDGDEKTVISYGKSVKKKFITTYFRHRFSVSSRPPNLRLSLLRDDGAVVYLNGVEILRSNMPKGNIGFKTLAPRTVFGSEESKFFDFAINPQLLRIGNNVIAVEMHQRSRTSSDVSFDLGLVALKSGVSVTRQPYLQTATRGSMTIRWRTSGFTSSGVWIGSTVSNLKLAKTTSKFSTDHSLQITGLTPYTRYFYAIGTSSKILAGGTLAHHFRTSPKRGQIKPTRVWVLGDSGTGIQSAIQVRNAYTKFAKTRPADFIVTLGDNAYWSGTDSEYQKGMFDVYPVILGQTPIWPTIGNHDSLSSKSSTQVGPYFDIFELPTKAEAGGIPSKTEAYYSFDYGNAHFLCLDSSDSDLSPKGAMLTWAKKDLAASKATWNIALFHHAPYTKGTHDSDTETRLIVIRRDLVPVLEAGGVDLVLSGHSHNYERSFLLNGHVGLSTTLSSKMLLDLGDGQLQGDGSYARPLPGRTINDGTVYVVAGTAGQSGYGTMDHPAMYKSTGAIGSLILDIDGNRLTAQFLTGQGKIFDRFTLEKGLSRTLTRILPRLSLSKGGYQGLILSAGKAQAGRPYLVLGSFGTSPGIKIGTVQLPLNPDAWFLASLTWPNGAIFRHTWHLLDAKGEGLAAIRIPKGTPPALLGLSLYHAYLTFGPNMKPRMASNAVRLKLTK